MYTIRTRYLGPTDHRCSRIKVKDSNGAGFTFDYPGAARNPHEHCAQAFLKTMNPGAKNLRPVYVTETEDRRGNIYTTNRDIESYARYV